MKDDPNARPGLADEFDDDDIEIIEVVGLDEDVPTASDADEIELRFDEAADDTPEKTGSADERSTAERLLRLQAEFENFKRRMEREKDDHYRHATAVLVARLLPVLDNLERALAAGESGRDEGSLGEGVALIQRQLLDELRKEGLRPVGAVGQPFDPTVHEAVATDASTGEPPNIVIEELQRGYYFQDRLLRPAAVRVSVDGSGPTVVDDATDASEES
jgi:molecular chaperone GrpE